MFAAVKLFVKYASHVGITDDAVRTMRISGRSCTRQTKIRCVRCVRCRPVDACLKREHTSISLLLITIGNDSIFHQDFYKLVEIRLMTLFYFNVRLVYFKILDTYLIFFYGNKEFR
ncbi:hypothetical protein SFRURICE_001287 [Spodoptera frugiperda]|nr:hypothetical protein SFRURICE_001287 [Spodoptera frugiperda]